MAVKKPKKVRVRETMVVTVGARPPVYAQRIVRNNRTGQLARVDMNPELPPIDPGDEGRAYVFRRDEEVYDDHEAVKQSPHLFVPVED